jgi:hemerythrin-like domain-containing protein
MIEHRLILRMISLIDKEVKRIGKDNTVNQTLIETAMDFIRTYSDRTHHGKEEQILFPGLAKKKLSDVDNNLMAELIQDHAFGRATTAKLIKAADAYEFLRVIGPSLPLSSWKCGLGSIGSTTTIPKCAFDLLAKTWT